MKKTNLKWVWDGKRVTPAEWKALKAKDMRRKRAGKMLLPPGIAGSNRDTQISWLIEQMKELAKILKLPSESTLKDLVPHAKRAVKLGMADYPLRVII